MASVLCLVKDMVAWRTRCLSCKQVPEQCSCTIWYDIVWLINHETSQQDITTQSQEKKPKRKNKFSRLSDSNSKLWVWPCRLSCLPELSGKAQWLQLGQQSLAFIFQLLFRYSECFWLLDGLFECKHVGWDSESASIGDVRYCNQRAMVMVVVILTFSYLLTPRGKQSFWSVDCAQVGEVSKHFRHDLRVEHALERIYVRARDKVIWRALTHLSCKAPSRKVQEDMGFFYKISETKLLLLEQDWVTNDVASFICDPCEGS